MSFTRAFSLARYNWPLYAICFTTAFSGFAIALTCSLPPFLQFGAFAAAAIALWYAVASFWAFHLMFDRPELLSGEWLKKCVSEPPKSCIQLSVCLEETTLPIQSVFPLAQCTNLDLFDESIMTEPAIARAKQENKAAASIIQATAESLPLDDNSTELTVVTLAAHEVRDKNLREKLFSELARVTRPDGRIVVAEHLRNIPAALAFGLGLFHFYPRSEWVALANATDLRIQSEFNVTPFVHIFVFQQEPTLSQESAV